MRPSLRLRKDSVGRRDYGQANITKNRCCTDAMIQKLGENVVSEKTERKLFRSLTLRKWPYIAYNQKCIENVYLRAQQSNIRKGDALRKRNDRKIF